MENSREGKCEQNDEPCHDMFRSKRRNSSSTKDGDRSKGLAHELMPKPPAYD